MSENQVTVFLYEEELNYLKWLVLQKPNTETGGDLFGLWQSENTAVVQLLLGPGKNCSRTTSSFYQDVDYLDNVGNILTTSQGLCNIGEWHSHHRIDLIEPSGGDQTTVWNHIKSIGGKFLVFIANISGPANNQVVNVGCFLFNNATKEMQTGRIKCLKGSSPLRPLLETANIIAGAERLQDWNTFQKHKQTAKKEQSVTEIENQDIASGKDDSDHSDHSDHSDESQSNRDTIKKETTCCPVCVCYCCTELYEPVMSSDDDEIENEEETATCWILNFIRFICCCLCQRFPCCYCICRFFCCHCFCRRNDKRNSTTPV